jgi:hypothetical protein
MTALKCDTAMGSDERPTLQPYAHFLQSPADLVFIVEGKELLCHRRVLAAESRVFAAMLESVLIKNGVRKPSSGIHTVGVAGDALARSGS